YQLHNPRMDAIERDDVFEQLDRLRDEGKLRHYGVALGPAIGWREEGLRAIDERRIASVQTVYNVLEQDPGRDFLAAAERRGVGAQSVSRAGARTAAVRRSNGLLRRSRGRPARRRAASARASRFRFRRSRRRTSRPSLRWSARRRRPTTRRGSGPRSLAGTAR